MRQALLQSAGWAANGRAHPLVYRVEDDVLLRQSLAHRLANAAQGGQTLVDGVEGLVLARLGGLKVLRCVPRLSSDTGPPGPSGWAPRAGSARAAAPGHLLELGGGSAVLVVLGIVIHAAVALLRIQFRGWRLAPAKR